MKKIQAVIKILSVSFLFLAFSCEFLNPPLDAPSMTPEVQESIDQVGEITLILPARRHLQGFIDQEEAESRVVYLSDQGQERASLWLGDALVEVYNSLGEVIFTTTASSDFYFDTQAVLQGIPYGQNYYIKVSAFNDRVSLDTPVVMGISELFSVGVNPVEVGVVLLPVAPIDLPYNSAITANLDNYLYHESVAFTSDFIPQSLGGELWYKLIAPADGLYRIEAQPNNNSSVNICFFDSQGLSASFGLNPNRNINQAGDASVHSFSASAGEIFYIGLDSMSTEVTQTSINILFSSITDTNEPNNDPSNAIPSIYNQGTTYGILSTIDDEDYYHYPGTAGDALGILAYSHDFLNYTLFYDNGGTLETISESYFIMEGNLALEYTGDYYLRVRDPMWSTVVLPTDYSIELLSLTPGTATFQIDSKEQWNGKNIYLQVYDNGALLAEAQGVLSSQGGSFTLNESGTSTPWTGLGSYTLNVWVDMDNDRSINVGDELCDYYFFIDGNSTNYILSSYLYTFVGQDRFEPNETRNDATAVSIGSLTNLSMDNSDKDYFSLNVVQGQDYVVLANAFSENINDFSFILSSLEVFSADGNYYPAAGSGQNDTGDQSGRTEMSYVAFQAESTETLYFSVSGGCSRGFPFLYDFTIREPEPIVPRLRVTDIPVEMVGHRLYGTIVPTGGDPSQPVAECLVLIQGDEAEFSPKLLRSSQPWSGKGTWDFYLQVDVDDSGLGSINHGDVYYQSSVFLDSVYANSDSYMSFNHFVVSVPEDSHEPNNDMASAPLIPLDSPQALTIYLQDEAVEDVDYFRFAVEAGEMYNFHLTIPETSSSFNCRLLDFDGSTISADYVNTDKTFFYSATENKEIYLAVNYYKNSMQLSYDLLFEKAKPGSPHMELLTTLDMNANDHIEAILYPLGGDPAVDGLASYSGQLSSSDISTGVAPFTLKDIQTSQPWSGLGAYGLALSVFPDNGGSPDRDNGYLYVSFNLSVYEGAEIQLFGGYLEFIFPPDALEVNDTRATASPLNFGTSINSNLHDGNDIDYFIFPVSSPGFYTLSLTSEDAYVEVLVEDSSFYILTNTSANENTATTDFECTQAGDYYLYVTGMEGSRYSVNLEEMTTPSLLDVSLSDVTSYIGETFQAILVPEGGDPAIDGVAWIRETIALDSNVFSFTDALSNPWSGLGYYEIYCYIDKDNSGNSGYSAGDYICSAMRVRLLSDTTETLSGGSFGLYESSESNNTSSQAVLLLLNTPLDGGLHESNDVDWYSLQVEAARDYTISLNTDEPNEYVMLSLYENDGITETLFFENWGGLDQLSININSSVTETRYVRVSGNGGVNYQLSSLESSSGIVTLNISSLSGLNAVGDSIYVYAGYNGDIFQNEDRIIPSGAFTWEFFEADGITPWTYTGAFEFSLYIDGNGNGQYDMGEYFYMSTEVVNGNHAISVESQDFRTDF